MQLTDWDRTFPFKTKRSRTSFTTAALQLPLINLAATMATGIEVTGVVLALIPIVISALEHRGKGVAVLRVLCEYERGLHLLARDLRAELAKFQNVCKVLLTGLISPSRVTFMINNPLSELWRDSHVKKRILARLGPSSIPDFEVSVSNINRAIELMRSQLEIQNSSVFAIKRILFTRNNSVYIDAMSTIVANIAELQWLASRCRGAESELATKTALLIPSQRRARFGIIRGSSKYGLEKALRPALKRSSRDDDVGLAVEGTHAASAGAKEDKATAARVLVFQIGIFLKKSDTGEGSENDSEKAKVGRRQTWQEALKRGLRPTISRKTLELPSPQSKPAKNRTKKRKVGTI
jgi:hypothetical protein